MKKYLFLFLLFISGFAFAANPTYQVFTTGTAVIGTGTLTSVSGTLYLNGHLIDSGTSLASGTTKALSNANATIGTNGYFSLEGGIFQDAIAFGSVGGGGYIHSAGDAWLAGGFNVGTTGTLDGNGATIAMNSDGSFDVANGNLIIGSDGTVYGTSGTWRVNVDGGGFFSNGQIGWDGGGDFSVGDSLYVYSGGGVNFNATVWFGGTQSFIDATGDAWFGANVFFGSAGIYDNGASSVINNDGSADFANGSFVINGDGTFSFNSNVFKLTSGQNLSHGDGTGGPTISFNYQHDTGAQFSGVKDGVTDQMDFGFNNQGTLEGSEGDDSGRQIYIYDRVGGQYLLVFSPSAIWPQVSMRSSKDYVVLDSGFGTVLKSPNGHYWRESISNSGTASWSDLGTTAP